MKPGVVLLIGLVLLGLYISGNTGSDEQPAPSTPGTVAATQPISESDGAEEARPGNPAVYVEIAASTDCAWLQETFDRNMDRYEASDAYARQQPGNPGTWEKAYADAADDRMREAGCYG